MDHWTPLVPFMEAGHQLPSRFGVSKGEAPRVKQRRNHHSEEEWEDQKDRISRLYNEHSLIDVVQIMKDQYNFHAG